MRIAVKQDRSTDIHDGLDRLDADPSTYSYLIYYKGDLGETEKRWDFPGNDAIKRDYLDGELNTIFVSNDTNNFKKI